MIDNKIFRYFFYVVLFIGVLVALNVSVRRYHFESEQGSVEVALSLRELKQAALHGSVELSTFLSRLEAESSVSTICVEEATLQDFVDAGQMTLLKGSDIMNMHRVGHVNRTVLNRIYKQIKVKPDYFYLLIDQKHNFERIRDFLRAEFGKNKVTQIKSYNILEVLDTKEDLLSLGLGISASDVRLVEKYGFKPVYRLKNSTRLTPAIVKLKIMSFLEENQSSRVFFEGNSVLGYPLQMEVLLSKFEDKQVQVGFVEFGSQNGLKPLLDRLPNNTFRIHSIGIDQQQTLSMTTAVSRYVRATKERGMALLFVHPYTVPANELPLVDYNLQYMNALTTQLVEHGFSLVSVDQFPQQPYFSATFLERFWLSFVVLTTLLFFVSFFTGISVLSAIGFYGISLGIMYVLEQLGYGLFVSKSMAFLVTILFPTLALISQFPQEKLEGPLVGRFMKSFGFLLRLVAICLMGAVFIVSFLSDVLFLKGVELFWGVKLSYLVPLVLIGLFFYLRPHRIRSTFFVLRRLYYAPVRTAGLISIFAAVFFLGILLVRSGNFVPWPTAYLETHFRGLMETLFYVRPRTKEFLIGYPFLMLSFMFVDYRISRLWIWFFNLLGAISLISVVNSFCHIHTPLQISLYRTILGLVLGVGVTFAYLFLYELFSKLFLRKTAR